MSLSFCRVFSAGRQVAVIACTLALGLLAVPAAAQAQITPTIAGSLANFDVVNDTEGEKEGFEIQLEGLQPSDITRVFGQAGATCYIRYCIGSVTPYGTPGVAPFGVYVRWMASYDPLAKQFITDARAPGGGSSGTPSTVGVLHPNVATGENCWSLGLGSAYPTSGCEHFGVSTLRNPTKTTYRWLVGDPATGLMAAAPDLAPVAIPHPVAIQIPPAKVGDAPQVQVEIAAQPPVALDHRYGLAMWAKVYKSELGRDAGLDELVGGHPNDIVPNNRNGAAETEWKLLQLDVTNPDKGGSRLQSHGSPNGGSHAVVRRYEFYKYTGPVVTPGQTSGKGGGPRLLNDDQEASQCPRDPASSECTEPGPGELGDFIGAQMAAQNLAVAVPSIAWAAPANIAYGTPLGAAQLNAVATNAAGAVLPGTFAYTPDPGSLLSVGTHTLQVLFIPEDTVTYGSQMMIAQITVEPALLTIAANHATKGYAANDPILTYSASGFRLDDTAAAVLTGSLARAAGESVGSYAITRGTLAASGNYALAFTGSTLDITPAPLTVQAADAVSVYGRPTTFAGTEFTVSGLWNLDSIASVTLASAGAAGTAAGSFPIVPSGAAGAGLTNYTITYLDGTLNVIRAALAVDAAHQTKTFGADDPPLAFAVDGLQFGDTAATALTGALSRAPGEAAGTYPILQGTLAASANYTIAFTGSTLDITAPPPPQANAIVNPGNQRTREGDEVELEIQLAQPAISARRHRDRDNDDRNDRNDRMRGVFSAMNLPPGLEFEMETGVIHGRVKKNSAAEYQVTVLYQLAGITSSQRFEWTILKQEGRREDR